MPRPQLEAIEPGSFPRFLAYLSEAANNYESGFASRPFASKVAPSQESDGLHMPP
jgi:hypothetical protein